MNGTNLSTLSSSAEEPTNLVAKKIFGRIETASSISFAISVGTTPLRYSTETKLILEYDFTKPSYIRYMDLDQKKEMAKLHTNAAIDLVKIENLNKIQKMAQFKNNWNGTGGSTFSISTIKFFKIIIEALVKQPQIAPTGRNSLLMQYELEDKSLLAFEVGEEKTDKVYIPKGDYSLAEMEMFTENISQQINESVERFYGFKEY